MATEKQIEANRLNALKSTGPKTGEGKDASRRNALQHGLAARTILAGGDEAAAAERAEGWAEDLEAGTPFQRFLVERMAADSVRAERCARQYEALKARQATRAEANWDEDRAAEAEGLGRRLARDPVMALHRLRSGRHGCEWLAARWGEWIADVEARGLDGPLEERALDLLGVDRDRREGAGRDVSVEAARAEVERLGRRIEECLAALDEADRESAAAGIGPDDLDARRLRRYESGCMRRVQWAHAQVRRSRRGKPASRRPAGWAEYDYAEPDPPMPTAVAGRTNPIPAAVADRTNPIPAAVADRTNPIPADSGRRIAPETRAEAPIFRASGLATVASFRDAFLPTAPIGNRRLRRAMARAAGAR